MADPTYPLFSIFAFLGFVLGLVPFPWHLHAWNAGTCVFMLWASLSSFVQFVNSIVWFGSMDNAAPVWCDIASTFLIGAGVGIPAASLCINRRLYHIASVRTVSISPQDKRRAVLVDIAISIGIPMLVMILHYIVQGHRYDIVEDIGCLPTTFWTPVAIPLAFMWPTVIGCISFVYAALTLRAFWIRRTRFKELLSSNESLTVSRYFRLMLLPIVEMSCTIPISLFAVYIITHGVPVSPWKSWSDTHYHFSYVGQLPAVVWRSDPSRRISFEMTRWLNPCSALLFFSLFGFADEAKRQYRKAFNCIKKTVSCWTSKETCAAQCTGNRFNESTRSPSFPSRIAVPAPVYSSQKLKRIDSLFSSDISLNNADIEKGASSSTCTPLSASSNNSETVIGCSELYSESLTSTVHLDSDEAPTFPPRVYESSPSPPFCRPLSPSTTLPVAPTPTASAESTFGLSNTTHHDM